jgi:hypothetical protein
MGVSGAGRAGLGRRPGTNGWAARGQKRWARPRGGPGLGLGLAGPGAAGRAGPEAAGRAGPEPAGWTGFGRRLVMIVVGR